MQEEKTFSNTVLRKLCYIKMAYFNKRKLTHMGASGQKPVLAYYCAAITEQ